MAKTLDPFGILKIYQIKDDEVDAYIDKMSMLLTLPDSSSELPSTYEAFLHSDKNCFVMMPISLPRDAEQVLAILSRRPGFFNLLAEHLRAICLRDHYCFEYVCSLADTILVFMAASVRICQQSCLVSLYAPLLNMITNVPDDCDRCLLCGVNIILNTVSENQNVFKFLALNNALPVLKHLIMRRKVSSLVVTQVAHIYSVLTNNHFAVVDISLILAKIPALLMEFKAKPGLTADAREQVTHCIEMLGHSIYSLIPLIKLDTRGVCLHCNDFFHWTKECKGFFIFLFFTV